jgi:FkbM family methyltransferase
MNIVQIGAHTGDDHVTEYVKNNPYDLLVLVEANPNCIEELIKNYDGFVHTVFINQAVVSNDLTEIQLYFPEKDLASQHVSLTKSHLVKHGHNNIGLLTIKCANINQVLEKYVPDRLYIDVEGLDIDLVDAIDFIQFKPNYIEFEYIHSDGPLSWGGPKLDSCLKKLETEGYQISKNGYNVIAELKPVDK